MRVRLFDDPDAFAKAVTPFCMQREAERNWFLGMLPRLREFPDAVKCAVEDESGAVVSISLMTPPSQMGTSSGPAGAPEALADELTRRRFHVPGIQGDNAAVDRFAAHWSTLHPVKLRDGGAMGIYQLEHIVPPATISGALRLASAPDFELLVRWHEAFQRDCQLPAHGDLPRLVEQAIKENRRFLWCDPEPVSMAGIAGPTPNGIRVQAVYTPPQHRQHGYASMLVARVSQLMLDSGKRFCFLFTDLANPTSNKIYQQIGYHHIADAKHIIFDPV